MVDNNSSDNSVEIFKMLGDERFECRRHSRTVSLGANFNRCLKYVSSEYYCIMHADDEYSQDYLEIMLKAMNKHPNAILAFCNANIIDNVSKKRFSIKNELKKMNCLKKNEYFGSEGLDWISEYNKIIAPSVMYRNKAITIIGKFNSSLKFTLDWEYYFRALRNGSSLLHVNKTLFNYRVHSKQQTSVLIESMTKYYEIYSLIKRIYHFSNKNNNNFNYKFIYLKFSIIFDMINDLINLKLNSIPKKIYFFAKLFKLKIPNKEYIN